MNARTEFDAHAALKAASGPVTAVPLLVRPEPTRAPVWAWALTLAPWVIVAVELAR